MSEVGDVEAERVASSFRPNRKPWFIAIAANGMLAVLLLGIPYLRGRALADDARRHFAELSRCLMGGEIAGEPGLSLPRGDREHFADKVMHAGTSWPLSCRPALARLTPEPAIFLWPSVKQASVELRAAAELTDRELQALSERRKAGLHRVPERVLQALRRVQAATVLLARAGGAEAHLDNDAIAWRDAPPLASPARLPLMASHDATLDLYSTGTALEALALDGRGVSYLRVEGGKVDRERVRRTSFLRGALRAGDEVYLVWAMPDSRCEDAEDACASRPTGLAAYERGGSALGEPTWKLDGHPAGRIDRALSVSGRGRALLLARAAAEGGRALLRFQLEPPDAGLGTDSKPELLAPLERVAVHPPSAASAAAIVAGAEPPAVVSASAGGADPAALDVRVTWSDPAREPVPLPSVAGEGPWTLGCGSAGALLVAYGTSTRLRVARVDGEPATARELLAREVELPGALHAEDPARDRVQLTCTSDGRALVSWIDRARRLWNGVCAANGCSEPRSLVDGVDSFATVATPQGWLVAAASAADEVRVLRLDARGEPRAEPYAPSACFEPPSGLCGTPALTADGQRIVLAARDRSDLLALESTDGGASFVTLSGLAGANAGPSSSTAPLEQHRLRKGMN